MAGHEQQLPRAGHREHGSWEKAWERVGRSHVLSLLAGQADRHVKGNVPHHQLDLAALVHQQPADFARRELTQAAALRVRVAFVKRDVVQTRRVADECGVGNSHGRREDSLGSTGAREGAVARAVLLHSGRT